MKRPSLLMPVYGRSNEENDLLFSFRDRDWKQCNRSSSFCRAEEEESPLPRFGRAENPKNGVTSVGATVWGPIRQTSCFSSDPFLSTEMPLHYLGKWSGHSQFILIYFRSFEKVTTNFYNKLKWKFVHIGSSSGIRTHSLLIVNLLP